MRWDALMAAVQARMTAATQLSFGDGSSRLLKSRLDPITMQVATRSGNKKVAAPERYHRGPCKRTRIKSNTFDRNTLCN